MRNSPPLPCSEIGCERPSRARGLCKQHYSFYYDHGIPLPPRKFHETAMQRFEHWCDRSDPDGHWLWTGATSSGYGVITTDDGDQEYTHRWAYMTFVGPIPDGLIVGHECHDLDITCRGGECFHRRCMQPDHLKPMTKGDNLRAGRLPQLRREMGAERRAKRTHCRHGHELNEANRYVRPSDGAQVCRVCSRVSMAKYKAAKAVRA